MTIGLPKEIKKEEYRVGLTPESAAAYIEHKHTVIVETNAGAGSGFSDSDYKKAGCVIESDKRKLFERAEMIVKVKEPIPEEYALFREGQMLFTYLHLASDKALAECLIAKKVTAVAYETVTESDGSLPLLRPMSEIAGRLSVQDGAKCLERSAGGRGILLGGVAGIKRGKVTIVGGGVAGMNACRVAVGFGAEVTIIDISPKRLTRLEEIFGSAITTLYSTDANIADSIRESDLVIGAVLIPGAAAPKLITKEHLKTMKKGAVIVDVAVDQGGCCETTHPTTHNDPTFIIDGIVHYCVANMPGAVPLSATYALTSVTMKYGLMLADNGDKAFTHAGLRAGVNTYQGKCRNSAVAKALDLAWEAL